MKIFTRRWLSALFIAASVTLYAGSDSQEEPLHGRGGMAAGNPSEVEPQGSQHPSRSGLKAVAVYLKSLVSEAPAAPQEESQDDQGAE